MRMSQNPKIHIITAALRGSSLRFHQSSLLRPTARNRSRVQTAPFSEGACPEDKCVLLLSAENVIIFKHQQTWGTGFHMAVQWGEREWLQGDEKLQTESFKKRPVISLRAAGFHVSCLTISHQHSIRVDGEAVPFWTPVKLKTDPAYLLYSVFWSISTRVWKVGSRRWYSAAANKWLL